MDRRHAIMYGRLAPLYDLGLSILALPAGGEERLRALTLDALTPLGKGLRVLELCAGTASLSIRMARSGAVVAALDHSADMLSTAAIKAKESRGPDLRLTAIRGDAAAVPFMDGSFDRVVVSLGLHELGVKTAAVVLSEAFRVLKSGGRLVILDFHRAEGFAARTAQWLLFAFVEGEEASEWIRANLQGMVAAAGFRDFARRFLAARSLQVVAARRP